MKSLGPLIVLALALGLAPPSAAVDPSGRTFVVAVFDGFAPVYLERFATPTFDRLREEGAWTHRMEPVFPSISLVNGVTISTGCWPEHHGIVSNVFLDPERGRYDHSTDADWLIGCEHLHQAAERQGVRAAALGWYGRLSTSRGPLASVVPPDEEGWTDFPEDAGRADQVIELLERPPAERPGLILAYFKGPDAAGHYAGMESREVEEAVVADDAAVGRILDAIAAQPDAARIQLLVTTDHGMMPVTYLVNVARILRRHDVHARALSSGTSSFLYFDDPKDVGPAAERLSGYEAFDVVRRDAQPADWHLGTGGRVGQLILSARPPYFIEDSDEWPDYLHWLTRIGPDVLPAFGFVYASHGYPPDTPGVQGILYAWGSAFARGREVERVRAVDIHPTVMHVLGLEPGRPVDGVVAEALLRE